MHRTKFQEPQHRELPVVFRATKENKSQLQRMLRTRQIQKVRPGVFAFPPTAQTPENRREETTLLAIAGAQRFVGYKNAFSHLSAATLWGLPLVKHDDAVHITHRGGSNAPLLGIVRHNQDLPSSHLTTISGVSVTHLERTVVDCLRILEPMDGLIIADGAARIGLDVELALRINAESKNPRFRQRTRTILEMANPGAQSPGESVLRYRFLCAGWPGLQTQVEVRSESSTYYLDLGDEKLKIGFEYDGQEKYSDSALLQEKKREYRIRAQGWAVERFMAEDVYSPVRAATKIQQLARRYGVRLEPSLELNTRIPS